jgi:hypothetical protein
MATRRANVTDAREAGTARFAIMGVNEHPVGAALPAHIAVPS